MKKIIVIGLILGAYCAAGWYESHYTRKDCVAIQVSPTGAILEDKCGFTWYVEEEGFEVGDIADIKMHNNFTHDCIDDDEILKVVRAD
jgi:hypothetical protein